MHTDFFNQDLTFLIFKKWFVTAKCFSESFLIDSISFGFKFLYENDEILF